MAGIWIPPGFLAAGLPEMPDAVSPAEQRAGEHRGRRAARTGNP